MSALDDIFGSLIITPEQQMRLRNHEAEFRTATRESAADESRKDDEKDRLDASLARAEQDQSNIVYFVQSGMGAIPVRGKMTSPINALALLFIMAGFTVATPFHPDLALVVINLAFAVGCAVEGILIWRQA